MSSNKFQDYIEFIVSILKRPGMYCVSNVEDIYLISFGYLSGLKDDYTAEFMSDFREYVNKDFEMDENYDWVRVIRFHSGGDKNSIELFSKLFFNFLKSKGVNINDNVI